MGSKNNGAKRSQRQKSIIKPKTTISLSPSAALSASTPTPGSALKSRPDHAVSQRVSQ